MNNLKLLFFGLCLLNIAPTTVKCNTQPVDTIQNYLKNTIDFAWDLSNKNPDSTLIIVNKAIEVAELHNTKKEKAELFRLKGLVKFYKVDYAGGT